jgi:hypothetical protein
VELELLNEFSLNELGQPKLTSAHSERPGGTFCNPDEFDFSQSVTNTGFRTHQKLGFTHGVDDSVNWLASDCLETCSRVELNQGNSLDYGR